MSDSVRSQRATGAQTPSGRVDHALGLRILAALIDLILLAIVGGVLSLLTGQFRSEPGTVQVSLFGAPFLIFLAIVVVYFVVLEGAWDGYTLGKRLVGIQVVSETGDLSWGAVIIRNLFRIIDYLPGLYLLGFIIAVVNEDRKRLGDFAAKTQVVRS